MPEQQNKPGLLKRLRDKRRAQKQRASDKSHRGHQGAVQRGGRRQDGFKEGVPGVSDQGLGGF
jgi:hypothetical protein